MLTNAVLYHVTRGDTGGWRIHRNANMLLAWRDLFGAVDIATRLAEFEASRASVPVKVVWDGRNAPPLTIEDGTI